MRIAILSKMNHRGGGASRVAETLTKALRARGQEAVMFTLRPHASTPHALPILPGGFRRLVATVNGGFEVVAGRVIIPVELPFLRHRLRGFDIVHVHDMWSAFSPRTLRWVSEHYPTALTLHDCASFTGGCLYMYDCERHRDSCGSCPRKGEASGWLRRVDFTAGSLSSKRRVHKGAGYNLIAPSAWMGSRATESGVFRPPITVIPNACDLDLFNPSRRNEARNRLRLALHEQAILVSATKINDPRKGVGDASRVLVALAQAGLKPAVIVMGRDAEEFCATVPGRVINLGYVEEPDVVADAYAAANIYLFPSKADNLPLSVQESMGSGTPVAAYRVGGLPEMICNGVDGILTAAGDTVNLAAEVAGLLRDRGCWERFSAAARAQAVANWTVKLHCDRHLDFYRHMLGVSR